MWRQVCPELREHSTSVCVISMNCTSPLQTGGTSRRQQQHSTVFHYSRNLYIIKQMASLQTNTALLSEGEGVSTRKTLKAPPQQTGRPRQDLERWDLPLFQVSSSQILPQCCPSMCTAKDNYVVLFMMVFPYTKWLWADSTCIPSALLLGLHESGYRRFSACLPLKAWTPSTKKKKSRLTLSTDVSHKSLTCNLGSCSSCFQRTNKLQHKTLISAGRAAFINELNKPS